MAANSQDWYTLEPSAEFHDLSAFDFADIFWQAFDVDKLESITLEATRADDRINVLILAMKPRRKKKTK